MSTFLACKGSRSAQTQRFFKWSDTFGHLSLFISFTPEISFIFFEKLRGLKFLLEIFKEILFSLFDIIKMFPVRGRMIKVEPCGNHGCIFCVLSFGDVFFQEPDHFFIFQGFYQVSDEFLLVFGHFDVLFFWLFDWLGFGNFVVSGSFQKNVASVRILLKEPACVETDSLIEKSWVFAFFFWI